MSLLIGVGIAFILAGFYSRYNEKKDVCPECVNAHVSEGKNYEWLAKKFGRVIHIKFEEPIQSNEQVFQNEKLQGNWTSYTNEIWKIHCKVINHKEKLIESHYNAFINPTTRFARLCFTFQKEDGTIYEMEPTLEFYELEDEYFKNYIHC